MSLPPFPTSPFWSKSTKRLITAVLLVLALLLVYWVRGLLIFLLLSVILAYLLLPVVNLLHRRTPLPRLAAIAVVYLVIFAGLISIPVTTIPLLIDQFNAFVANTPRVVSEINGALAQPIIVGDNEFIPLEWPPVQEAFNNFGDDLINIAQTVGTRSVSLLGSVATTTLSTVGWILVVLFISFYMIKDYQLLFGSILDSVPQAYREDFSQLATEISATWNAFLRGQLILFAIMGTTVFSLATLVGLPNALFLGLVSGLAEFLPQIGAILAMIPAVLIAFFQSDASWLGRQMSPFLFMLFIMGAYILLQQIENYLIVPRIIGRQLKLHPLLVFVAALVGARSAGILGILVAAPILASGRLVLRYVNAKLQDRPPFTNTGVAPLTSRPARSDDRTAVATLAAQRWDGDDPVIEPFNVTQPIEDSSDE